MHIFSRTELLFGSEAMERIYNSSVIIFGVGGVGSFAAEAVARSGVGRIALVDNDTVSLTNINRQLIALSSTVGRLKTEVMKERIAQINPDCRVEIFSGFYSEEDTLGIGLSDYDYVVDAIDSVKAKVFLITEANRLGVKIISSMGTGNKLDPSRLAVCDISKTHTCPLAKVMRRELGLKGIKHLKVVFSDEPPVEIKGQTDEKVANKPHIPGSTAFVPSSAGLLIASAVIKELSEQSNS